jgi:small-conductance mechanosensitive channel
MENFSRTLLQMLFEPITLKILTAIIGAFAISLMVAFVRKSAGRYIQESSKRYASKKIIDFVGYFVGLIFITVVFKDTLGNLAVIVGAATAGIAFALKEVIVSVAGWIAVTFGDFYKVGDRIQLGGIKGDVIDIGFGRTTLMELGEWVKGDLYTGRIVRISNGFVFSEPFFNYSGDFPFLWDECTVPVKYGCDHRLARQILENVADQVSAEFIEDAEKHWSIIEKKYLVEHARTRPMVTLVLNDNWMEFTVRYVVNYRKRRLAKDLLFTRILDEIEKTKGRVGLASATFHLVEAPVFEVRMANEPSAKA